ncbi:MAG: hypothetical protein V1800_09855 [Candidatus Latescibacterota bacterium]
MRSFQTTLLTALVWLTTAISSAYANDPADFFPLHVGDVWEYDNYDIQTDWTVVEVVGDSAINGRQYYKMRETSSSVGNVYRYSPLWVRINDAFEVLQYSFHRQADVLMLRLDASVEDSWEGYEPLRSADFIYESDENWMPTVVLRDRGRMRDISMNKFLDFLEDEREALRFVYDFVAIENTYAYVDGIGLVGWAGEGNVGLRLRGAIIGGVRYGTLTVGVEPSSWGHIKTLFVH